MAAKKSTRYVCTSCEHEEPKWLGRCPACGSWNTLEETAAIATGGGGSRGRAGPTGAAVAGSAGTRTARAVPIDRITGADALRIPTGLSELDRVLGGGAGLGSSILIGGEPGIGKSTLMLQMAGTTAQVGPTLYVSGEESAGQLKARADRLKVGGEQLHVLANSELSTVLRSLDALSPKVIIVDSVQTLFSHEAGSSPGSVNQLKYCTFEITDWARSHAATCFFVAHVTKDGAIAGPKVMEHMVDTVLMFEEAEGATRILRSTKNRFGATDEIGLFTMSSDGLNEVSDPSSLFLVRRDETQPPGVIVAPVYEGSRILLVEIQALTVPAKGGISRVFSDRIDSPRVSRVAAVLEKHAGLALNDQDLYVNVAGGIRLTEVGVDVPLALALYSARTGHAIPAAAAASGELSLAGEIRPVTALSRRLKTVADHGLTRLIGPEKAAAGESVPDTGGSVWTKSNGIRAALKVLFG